MGTSSPDPHSFLLVVLLLGSIAATTHPPPATMSPLAFGTGSRGCSPPAACEAAVADALRLGWRTLDCAYEYGTQPLVRRGLNASGVPRSAVFIATKIPGPVGFSAALRYFKDDLERLGTPYVDLLLMHYPCGDTWPQPRDGCPANDTDAAARLDTWRAMETLVAAGSARAIGVSNFQERHLVQLVNRSTLLLSTTARPKETTEAAEATKEATEKKATRTPAAPPLVPPVVNQVQWHLGFHDDALLAYCKQHGITLQAYSALGGGGTSTGRDGGISLDDPVVTSIARRHNATNAQGT